MEDAALDPAVLNQLEDGQNGTKNWGWCGNRVTLPARMCLCIREKKI